jgi:hypothetical protein
MQGTSLAVQPTTSKTTTYSSMSASCTDEDADYEGYSILRILTTKAVPQLDPASFHNRMTDVRQKLV